MKYDIIFLDSDETVFDYRTSARVSMKEQLTETFDLTGQALDDAYNKYAEINSYLWGLYHKNKITKQELLDTYIVKFLDSLNLKADAVAFKKKYIEKLSLAQFMMPNAAQVLETLSKKCDLAIITNGISSVHRTRIVNSSIKNFIKEIIVSDEYDDDPFFQKPHSRIFEYAHRQVDSTVHLDDILMVGDNISSDILGGVNYNIDTCWYNFKKENNRTEISPTYVINDWLELPSLLGCDYE